MLHGHHNSRLVAQVCVEGTVASPCSLLRYCCSQNSSRSSSRYANFILLGNSGCFLVVPMILCNSSEEIRTQHHRRHVVCVHIVLHLSLTRKMQFFAAQTAAALASGDKKIVRGDAAANVAVRTAIHF